MTGVLFLSQANLDHWLEAGDVDMGQESLIFPAERTEYPMVPAVHFVDVVAGTDQHKLLGKVKAVEAMRLGGAEVSMGAVVMGDVAYTVEDGYMITVQLPDRPAASARPATAVAGRTAAKPTGQEADLLAQFILNKLS